VRPGVASPFPAGAHEALVRASILDGEAALAAWREWRRTVDFDRIDQASYRMVPLLYRNLERLRVDDPLLGTLRGIYRRTWCENLLLFRRLARVIGDLRAAGVESMVLKGAALASQAYGDAGARSMADFDLLVRRAEFGRARDVLLAAGWSAGRIGAEAWDRGPDAFHEEEGSISFRQEGDALRVLDLHSSVLRLYADRPVPFPEESLWRSAERFDVLGVPALRLGPGHALLHVLWHGVQAQQVAAIRWVPDAHLLLRARGRDVPWGPLLAEARRHRVLAPLREGLEFLSSRYATPVPAAVLRSLRRTPLSVVERVERPLRLGSSRAGHEYGKTLSPLLRRVLSRSRLRLSPLSLARDANRVLLRLPFKYGFREPLRLRTPARQ
jgi:hypothetical protein